MHQRRYAAGFSQLIIHGIPNRSTTWSNRSAQKVSPNSICTVPFLRQGSEDALCLRSGNDGEVGAVRFLGSNIGNEILVGKTELSYTYAQPVKPGQPYDLYHGTVEARPMTASTSKVLYTLVYDNSMLPDEAAREKDKAQRTALSTLGLKNMKSLAETGKLPPAPLSRMPREGLNCLFCRFRLVCGLK